jgi:hypothetical protein
MNSQIFVAFLFCLAKIGHLAIVEVDKANVHELWIDGIFLGI